MKRVLCWLLGHSRGPVADVIEHVHYEGTPGMAAIRFCGCCGERADGFSLVRRHSLLDGMQLQRGYGIAWIRYSEPAAMLMPIPLNLVAGLVYRLRWWIKVPRGLADCSQEAYRQGLIDGRIQGLEQARRVADLAAQYAK